MKKSVAEVKMEAEKDLYDALESKDREVKMSRIAKNQTKERDKTSQKYHPLKTRQESLNVEIQSRWKEYGEDLLNVENSGDPLPAAAPVHGPEPQVTMGYGYSHDCNQEHETEKSKRTI